MASSDQPVCLEQACHLNQVSHGDDVIGPGVDSSWGCMFLIDLKDTYSRFPFIQTLSLVCSSLPPALSTSSRLVFWPYVSSSDLHQSVQPGFGVGSQEGIRLLCYLNDWLVVVESVPLLFRHQEQLLQLCQDLGIVINWEKSDLKPTSRV